MKDASKVTAMVIDNGNFFELARTLGRTYRKVYYVPPRRAAFPTQATGCIGEGFDEMEVIGSENEIPREQIDLFVFPDVGYGHLQVELVGEGRVVWGSRLAEELEIYRIACKTLMKKLGLPLGSWKAHSGINELREHLRQHDKQFVKQADVWRGDCESFFSPNYQNIEPKLNQMEATIGARAKVMKFVTEDELPDCIELGPDTYCIDGQWPKSLLAGIEIKDKGYVGVFKKFSELPEPLTRWNTAMSPTLRRYGIRGFVSQETRIYEDGTPYMIDATMRLPAPPGGLMQGFYKNLAEIVWQGANGNLIEPEAAGKIGVELVLRSEFATNSPMDVDFPKENAPFIKLRNAWRTPEGRWEVMPQPVELAQVIDVIGWGSTLKEACDKCSEVADSINACGLEVPKGVFEDAEKQLEDAEKHGIKLL